MANGHGGKRQPARPAAVSNPQSGARTDGGAGSKSQPLRVPTGGGYGEAKALTEQQQGAPLAAGNDPQKPAGAPMGGGSAVQGAVAQPDLFRPTERPGEQMQMTPPADVPPSDMVLRQLAAAYPSPWILRMVGANGRAQ
jgi:hypothetical protein